MGYRRPMGKISKQLKNAFMEYKKANDIQCYKHETIMPHVQELTRQNLDNDFKKMKSEKGYSDPIADIYTLNINFFLRPF